MSNKASIAIPEALWKAANFRINFLEQERDEHLRRMKASGSPAQQVLVDQCTDEIQALYAALLPPE